MTTRKKPAQINAADKPGDSVAPSVPVPENTTLPNKPKKRRRLAKAFSYPLDAILESRTKPVRERFTILQGEYEQLIAMKNKLSDQGIDAKKSDLVRIGLGLLATRPDEEIEMLLKTLAPAR